jgi:hypothetical protein
MGTAQLPIFIKDRLSPVWSRYRTSEKHSENHMYGDGVNQELRPL